MTDRKQPHPQRCETCRWRKPPLMDQCAAYREHSIDCFEAYFDDFTSIVGCASHSSATEPAPDLSHIREDRRGCLNCLNPDCPVWQTADQNCWKSQKEHDAATKQAAREEVLTDLRKHLNKRADSLERNYPKGNDQRDGAQTRIAEIQQTLLALDAMESLRSGGK